MKRRNALLIFLLIITCYILYDIKYIGLTKYNIYPPKAVKDYMNVTYGKSVSFLEQNFYKDPGICVWSYRCEDEDGFVFNMYYEFFRDRPDTGYATVLHTENLESGVRDYYWQTRLQSVYPDELAQYRKDYEIGGPYKQEKNCIEIKEKNEIERVAGLISEVLYYTMQNVSMPSDETIDISVISHGKGLCKIYCKDVYIYKNNKAAIYDYIYNRICAEWDKKCNLES